MIMETKERLERGNALLLNLDRRRLETRSPQLGYNAEYLVIAAELRQLEADILRDPGALAAQLVRVDRKR